MSDTTERHAAIGKALLDVLSSIDRGVLEAYPTGEAGEPFGAAVTIYDGTMVLPNAHLSTLLAALNAP
jgi:hypothetical protein